MYSTNPLVQLLVRIYLHFVMRDMRVPPIGRAPVYSITQTTACTLRVRAYQKLGLYLHCNFIGPGVAFFSFVFSWDHGLDRFAAKSAIRIGALIKSNQSNQTNRKYNACSVLWLAAVVAGRERESVCEQRDEHGPGAAEGVLPSADERQERGHEGADKILRLGCLWLVHATGMCVCVCV